MLKRKLTIVIVALVAAMTPLASAQTFTGSMTGGGGGLLGSGVWDDPCTVLTWTVDFDTTTAGLWHYQYCLTVPLGGISHMIIEASKGPELSFTLENMFNLSLDPSNGNPSASIKDHIEQEGNPYLPSTMYGIKVDTPSVLELWLSFDSNVDPIWGDFYSKDGKADNECPDSNGDCSDKPFNAIWNSGFGDPDSDPGIIPPPHDRPEQGHLLVPDSNIIPEPTTLLLLAGGLLLSSRRKRRC